MTTMSSPASSTPGTPARSTHDASLMLTPRSKVKAMMASLDAELDDLSDEEISRLAGAKKDAKDATRSPLRESSSKDTTPLFAPLPGDGSESSEDDDDEARPRGKMVSRMLARGGASPGKTRDDARGGPKEKGVAHVTEKERSLLSDDGSDDDEHMADADEKDDEDDEGPVSARRKRAKTSPIAGSPKRASSAAMLADSDEDELPENPLKNSRFMALVEKKRKEREAREAEERRKKEERQRARELEVENEEREEEEGNDKFGSQVHEGGRARRKAGKKALEEMHRETQRLARSMQLAHQARTRKKITKQSLFDKFNFKPAGTPEPPSQNAEPAVDSSSTVGASDTEHPQSTPSSSPPPDNDKEPEPQAPAADVDTDEELPDTLDDLFKQMKDKEEAQKATAPRSPKGKGKAIPGTENDLELAMRLQEEEYARERAPQPKLDKGKGKAVEPPSQAPKRVLPGPRVRVMTVLPTRSEVVDNNSDDDLEIVDVSMEAKRRAADKEKLLASLRQKRRSMPKKPPPGSPGKVLLTAKQLQEQLLQKSRAQAARERAEHIEELKAKGVVILTAEERAKEQQEVENLVENARQEALRIQRLERKAAKKEKHIKQGEAASKASSAWEEGSIASSEGEEDWEPSGEEEEEEDGEGEEEQLEGEASNEPEDAPVEDPAAENDKNDRADEAMDDASTPAPTFSLSSLRAPTPTLRLSDIPEAYIENEASDSDDGGFAPLRKKAARKKLRVTDDDDDEMEPTTVDTAPLPPAPPAVKVPSIFAKAAQKPPVLGLSQFFGASAPPPAASTDGAKNLDMLRRGPIDELPNSQQPLQFTLDDEDGVVPETQADKLDSADSQSQANQQDSLAGLDLHYSQSQDMSLEDAMIPDPTPDQGFDRYSSPAPPRFNPTPEATPAPPGTVPTQILDEQFPAASERNIRRRRLMRRKSSSNDFSDEERGSSASDSDTGTRNAFSIMKKASRKKKKKQQQKADFDKSKSDAKDLVHEQASESEDEYAGLGGVSDEENSDASGADAEMADLLDETHQEVDENAMAAFFVEREKQRDEQRVSKLFRDIQNGLLRKKRGADFDLDDSDDEYLALERRRRQKRRQMLLVRRELLKDDDIKKIANDPKKAAFFRTLEDNQSDDERNFLDDEAEGMFMDLDDSQSQNVHPPPRPSTASSAAPPSAQPPSAQPDAAAAAMPPPPKPMHCRPIRTKKPSLASIRETLSFLNEDSSLHDSDSDSDSAPTAHRPGRTHPVIDRSRTLSRSSSSSSSNLAFHSDAAAAPGFRVPTLARRTSTVSTSSTSSTSNSTSTSASVSAATERSLGADKAGPKKSGAAGRGSSINFVREKGKRVVSERAVERRKVREKEGRARVGVLGGFRHGCFE